MKAEKIYVIPDQGSMTGGELYDRWGNFDFFADVTGLDEKTSTAVDKTINVASHERGSFMRDPNPSTVSAHSYSKSFFGLPGKGAYPGSTFTFVSFEDDGTTVQKRDFTFTGTASALVAFLKTTAERDIDIYGQRGNLVASVDDAGEGALRMAR